MEVGRWVGKGCTIEKHMASRLCIVGVMGYRKHAFARSKFTILLKCCC